MPILSSMGGLSASAYGMFNAISGSYESIATTTVGVGGTGTVTFSSIPSNYKHLQLRVLARGNNAAFDDSFYVRLNGDTANNYTLHWFLGDGATASALAIASYSAIRGTQIPGTLVTTNIFGTSVVDILDYASTAKFKTGRVLGGNDQNGSGLIGMNSGVWRNTAAVTTVTITPVFGTLFSQYSSFALYGIRG